MLYGSLKTLPLMELLPLLKEQEGALELWNLEGMPPTTLYLKPGRIRHIAQGKGPLDPLKAKAVLQALLFSQKGSFEFIPRARPPFKERLNWPVDRVLLAAFALKDELEHHRGKLPHPEIRFFLSPFARKPLERSDGSAKGRFLEAAWPHLERGATALELAKALDLPLDLVRYQLFKLRGAPSRGRCFRVGGGHVRRAYLEDPGGVSLRESTGGGR